MLPKYLGLSCLTLKNPFQELLTSVCGTKPSTLFFPGQLLRWEGAPLSASQPQHYWHSGRGSTVSCRAGYPAAPSRRWRSKLPPSVKCTRGRRRGGQTPQLRIRALARPPPELSTHQILQALGGRVRQQKRLGQSGPGVYLPSNAGLKPWRRLPFPSGGNAARLSLPL